MCQALSGSEDTEMEKKDKTCTGAHLLNKPQPVGLGNPVSTLLPGASLLIHLV